MSQPIPATQPRAVRLRRREGIAFHLVLSFPSLWCLGLLSDPWTQDTSLCVCPAVSLSMVVPCWTSVFGVKCLNYLKGWSGLGHPQ